MTRLSYKLGFALLVLLAGGAWAQQARVEITVNFLPAPPRTSGYEVWAEGARVHASVGNDPVVIPLRECGPNIRVQIRPADGRYTWPTYFCATSLNAEVRFIHTASLFWNNADGSAAVDYAESVAPVFDEVATAAAAGDEAALTLREAMSMEDSAALAGLARAAGEIAPSAELAQGYQILAVDAALRSAGRNPADGLLRLARDLGTPVLTKEGDDVLAELAPDWLPILPVEGASGRSVQIVSGTGSYSRVTTVGALAGLEVFDAQGVPVGQLLGFSADDAGSAIIEMGGFLGIGERPVAISSDALELGTKGVVLPGFTSIELEALPESKGDLLSVDAQVEFRFDG